MDEVSSKVCEILSVVHCRQLNGRELLDFKLEGLWQDHRPTFEGLGLTRAFFASLCDELFSQLLLRDVAQSFKFSLD